MSLSFDATFYQSQRPDVYNAFIATAGSTGLTWAEFAQQHYNTFGRFEGSDPSASFSTSYYLSTYPDVAAAGVNPFDHFLANGAGEMRVPYDGFPASSFVPATYAAANPDLAAAGITTDAALYQHWVIHGQFESRSGAPTVDTPNSGTTFTLTSSADNLTGTTGDDTFVAAPQAGNATLSPGDTLDGAGGTDTLQIFNAAGAIGSTNFGSANISSVEMVELTGSASAQTLDVSGNSDVTTATVVGGFDAVVTLGLSQTAGIRGTVNDAGADQTFTFTSTTGSADSANVALTDAKLANNELNIQNVETLNVAGTGTNSLKGFDTDATKVVVTGSGSVAFGAAENGGGASVITTFDASANTGGVSINNSSAAAANETITGGTGDDTYTTKFANLTKADTINLGDGTDVLAFVDATDLSTSTKAGVLGGTTNVETLTVTGGAFAFLADGDSLSQTTFVHDSTGAFTGTTFGNGDTLAIGDVVAAASTVTMKLGQNTANIALQGGTGAASDAKAGITITGASTVNVASSGTNGVADNAILVTTDGNGTINVTGSQNTTITTGVNAGTTGLSIDGNAATGKLTMTGTGFADNLVGGSAADSITGGAGVDTATGNAGNDKFIFATADVDTTLGAVTDIITDFATGGDSITIGFGAGSATNYVEAGAAVADLATLLTAADTALAGAVKYYVGQVGSDSYLVTDNNGTGYTDVIKLNGVALDGIAFTDIIA